MEPFAKSAIEVKSSFHVFRYHLQVHYPGDIRAPLHPTPLLGHSLSLNQSLASLKPGLHHHIICPSVSRDAERSSQMNSDLNEWRYLLHAHHKWMEIIQGVYQFVWGRIKLSYWLVREFCLHSNRLLGHRVYENVSNILGVNVTL
ncbi:hypothetical protein HNY73_021732 [Argiope bruennichi]|uniref:Uncharacterized protein n=1 Tax=Argiope bruennichi TaxID=94029 RepID=A0A8T0E0B6_ARGBR|nr:hypothetical protein HNY73_021732 [Argiope bruennichi]